MSKKTRKSEESTTKMVVAGLIALITGGGALYIGNTSHYNSGSQVVYNTSDSRSGNAHSNVSISNNVSQSSTNIGTGSIMSAGGNINYNVSSDVQTKTQKIADQLEELNGQVQEQARSISSKEVAKLQRQLEDLQEQLDRLEIQADKF